MDLALLRERKCTSCRGTSSNSRAIKYEKISSYSETSMKPLSLNENKQETPYPGQYHLGSQGQCEGHKVVNTAITDVI